ncbi:MAG: hypothetical protein HWE12_12910 [Oceanospirillaceae bacterium]|nr:hypothetical protein [Oceanospirillaceae bacterium]
MYWKSNYTAEEAVLVAMGAEGFDSLHDYCNSKDTTTEQIDKAEHLFVELCHEIELLRVGSDYSSCLKTFYESEVLAGYLQLDHNHTRLTTESLADWFRARDPALAERLIPTVKGEKQVAPSTKAINSQLRLIRILSEGLVGQLTGKHNKDAEAIDQALAAQGLTSPVGTKTLAKYLKEAAEL